MHSLQPTSRYRWMGQLLLLWSWGMVCGMTHAQQTDPVEAASNALKEGKFPWYDSDSNTAKPIESARSQSAASANRGTITPRTTPAPVTNTQTWSGWIRQLFDGLSSFSYVLLTLLASLIVGLLVWGLVRRRRAEPLTPDPSLGNEAVSMLDRIEELPFRVAPDAGDNFEGRALAAAKAGNYSEAVMLLFSFLLLNLDRKGLIRLRRGTTNRQYLEQIRHHDRLPDFFVQLMEPFEKSFFGGHAIDQAAFEQCWSNLESAKQRLSQSQRGER